VQEVCAGRYQSREKPRQHPHYLKGSVHCGECGEMLGVEVVKNRQGLPYPYYSCLGRRKRRTSCQQRSIMIAMVEELVEDYWRTATLPERQREELRQVVVERLDREFPARAREVEQAQREILSLENQSEKLLQAHYQDAVPMELFKREQARIARQRAAAEERVSGHQLQREQIERNLNTCLQLLTNAQAVYSRQAPVERRKMNQSVFQRLYLQDDRIVGADLTPVYEQLLSARSRRTWRSRSRPSRHWGPSRRPTTSRRCGAGKRGLPPGRRPRSSRGPRMRRTPVL